MNFFKSILSDDPDAPKPESPHDSDSNSPGGRDRGDGNPDDVSEDDSTGLWNFGGLIKTLATRSESVIETYRRDLNEFSSGLKKETEILRDVASRAVKDLPASLEAGASVAHGALDGVLKSTAEIISKETSIFGSDGEPESPGTNRSANSARYSWFESQLGAIQSDLNTFCEEPEDVKEFQKWKLGFNLEEKSSEIEGLIGENGALEGIYRKVVPNAVDQETFWFRYFYRVDKLKLQEKVRANLVKRAITVDEEEELSWDVDDEEEDANVNEQTSDVKMKGVDGTIDKGVSDRTEAEEASNPNVRKASLNDESRDEKEEGDFKAKGVDKNDVGQSGQKNSDDVSLGEKEVKPEEVKSAEKTISEETVAEKNDEKEGVEKGESGKKSEVSVVPAHESKVEEEEDMGWDEIEDMGSGDENKVSSTAHGGSPNRAELRKRLSAAEDDEDLSWDIEDDDEPVKA